MSDLMALEEEIIDRLATEFERIFLDPPATRDGLEQAIQAAAERVLNDLLPPEPSPADEAAGEPSPAVCARTIPRTRRPG